MSVLDFPELPPIPDPIQLKGSSLLHQQCWCWGQDIRAKEGNRLLAYGFSRTSAPPGQEGSTVYSLRIRTEATLTLWGFGLCLSEKTLGGMFLNRYEFYPRWTSRVDLITGIHLVEQLSDVVRPHSPHAWFCAHYLIIRAITWISEYEEWFRKMYGCDRREESLADFHNATVPANRIVECWRELAIDCESWFSTQLLLRPPVPTIDEGHEVLRTAKSNL